MRVGATTRSSLPAVAVGYAVALLATNLWLETSSPRTERSVLAHMSTDLWHLLHAPWIVVPASAFFTSGGLPYAIAGSLICVGLLEWRVGSVVTLGVAVSGHVVGTVVSEGVVAIRIAAHDVPSSAQHAIDVGPSYVLVACAVAVLAWRQAERWMRLVAALSLAPVFVFTAWRLPSGEIDAVGHLVAGATGVAWAWWLDRHPQTLQRWGSVQAAETSPPV